jgi:hypothetical protein
MEPTSLAGIGAAELGHAFTFLMDRSHSALDGGTQDVAAEHAIKASLGELERYRTGLLRIDPSDSTLVSTLQRLHSTLERVQGGSIDLRGAVEAATKVEQHAKEVRGRVIGAEVAGEVPFSGLEVTQRVEAVHEGGAVIGFRSGMRDK